MIDILYSYPTWVVIISTYIIVDLLYLFIFSKYLKKTNGTIANKKIFWTKCVITNIGSAFLLPILMTSVDIFGYVDILNDKLMNLWYINIEYPIESYYIYFKAVTFVWVLIGFVITIFVIYRIARRWIFNKLNIEKMLIKKYALTFAIVTAPWMLLCPEFGTKVHNAWCDLFNLDGVNLMYWLMDLSI